MGEAEAWGAPYLAGLPSSRHNAQAQHAGFDVVGFIGFLALGLGDHGDVHILQRVGVLGCSKGRSQTA